MAGGLEQGALVEVAGVTRVTRDDDDDDDDEEEELQIPNPSLHPTPQ